MHHAPASETVTRTTCPYCGVGCGVLARVDGAGAVTVAGDPDHPANRGRLCAKGAALAETLGHDDRLLSPSIGGRPATWDAALDHVADAFRDAIDRHGPDSVAFYVSGQMLTEDYYVANKLMKGFIGSGNIDTNSRLCMASAVAGHRRAFGADTVPGCYEDLELADLVVLVGSNLAWCHPVLHQRLMAAKAARPDLSIVVVDPRRTATAEGADLMLPIRSGSDIALFNGLLAHLDAVGALDRDFVAAHVSGFDAALGAARRLELADVVSETGLTHAELTAFYDLFARSEKVVTAFSMGVNQSTAGTDTVNAILNVHIATGRIRKPGASPFSITGQPNAMGGREVGGLANQLAAHGDLDDAEDRARVAAFWQAPALAARPGLKAVDLFRAVADGRIKALLVMATNPADSLPAADLVVEALKTCPMVAVADVTGDTDTAALAHVLLPAAAWGEKDGTVTNSERRISRQRAFLDRPGETKPDWWILAELGRRLGFAGFDWTHPAEIFAEHAILSEVVNEGRRDFRIGALATLDRAGYDAMAPVQWPQPAGTSADPAASTRFFADGRAFTADGRLRMVAVETKAPLPAGPGRTLLLNTGRVRDQWHTMTRTGRSARLSSHTAEPFCEIHPADAAVHGIAPASLMEIASASGRAVVRALVTPRVAPGAVFVPMHWTGRNASDGRIGAVVAPRVDPISGQPGSKATAVSVHAVPMAWYGFAVSRAKPQPGFADYHALARCRGGYRIELAGKTVPADIVSLARTCFSIDDPAVTLINVSDPASGRHRIVALRDGRVEGALWVAPEPVAVARSFAAEQLAADTVDLVALLAGRPGGDRPDCGAVVCTCFNVGVRTIEAAVAAGTCRTVDDVTALLKAGGNCGSCRPEIRSILDAERHPVPA